ncbi:MAG: GGDEF domain-containing protein, partial [Candidatus Competibacterales bacterium]|nr:GGDEF domain-containing protein [Candidatus Competibacterales bacterium]
ARAAGERILQTVPDTVAEARMRQFYKAVEAASRRLDGLARAAQSELNAQMEILSASNRHALLVFIVGSLVGTLLAGLASILGIGSALRSIRGLYEGLEHLKKGNFGHTVQVGGGEFSSLIETFNTVSALIAKEQNRLEALSERDRLTSLYNRDVLFRAMQTELSLRIPHIERRNNNVGKSSFLMLDLDHFKQVNDTYGHQTGDEALRQVASVISNSIRGNDRVARYGGEEIAVFLPNTDEYGAEIMGERLRRSIAALKIPTTQGEIISVTVSIGTATYPNDGQDVKTLIEKADRALYRAKNGGRNRVVSASPPRSPYPVRDRVAAVKSQGEPR